MSPSHAGNLKPLWAFLKTVLHVFTEVSPTQPRCTDSGRTDVVVRYTAGSHNDTLLHDPQAFLALTSPADPPCSKLPGSIGSAFTTTRPARAPPARQGLSGGCGRGSAHSAVSDHSHCSNNCGPYQPVKNLTSRQTPPSCLTSSAGSGSSPTSTMASKTPHCLISREPRLAARPQTDRRKPSTRNRASKPS